MATRGVGNVDSWLAAVVSILAFTSCVRSRTYEHQQEALYAAEAGLELAKMHIATVCRSAASISELRQRSTDADVSVPGCEQPTNLVLGQAIHGSLSVRLRTVEQEPPVWRAVSTGEYLEAKEVVRTRFTCAAIQGSKAQ